MDKYFFYLLELTNQNPYLNSIPNHLSKQALHRLQKFFLLTQILKRTSLAQMRLRRSNKIYLSIKNRVHNLDKLIPSQIGINGGNHGYQIYQDFLFYFRICRSKYMSEQTSYLSRVNQGFTIGLISNYCLQFSLRQ